MLNYPIGIQVQEILIEAIKVETERVLRQDTESTDTEDSADEARTSQNSLTNSTCLIITVNNYL